VVVEHGIGKLKLWQIASKQYRNPLGHQKLILKDVAGLYNLMYG